MISATRRSPLLFLAYVACDALQKSPSSSPSPGADDLLTGSPPQSRHSSTSTGDLVNLHIPCSSSAPLSGAEFRPLRHSNSSNHISDVETSPRRRKSGKIPSTDTLLHTKFKQQTRNRRQNFMDKAMRIKSLDNSPVNDHQLLVLRMVYDQITMYPLESWMVLIAIVIRRAFKQVKNWFSNERQKNKDGKSIRTQTMEGDKVRLRPLALQQWCPQWSDAFFEEVIMIYDYKVLMDLRASET